MGQVKKFFVHLGEDVWDRVIVSYKSTLTTFGIAVVLEVVRFTTDYLNQLPQQWAHLLAVVITLAGASLKNKQAKETRMAKRLAAATKIAAAFLLLSFATPAFAATATGPLSLQVADKWSLHMNVAVPAFAYSLTEKQFKGQLTFGLNYALDYNKTVAFGLGGGYLQTNDQPGVVITGMLGGPILPFQFGENTLVRPAVLYEYHWMGALHENLIAFTIALQLGGL